MTKFIIIFISSILIACKKERPVDINTNFDFPTIIDELDNGDAKIVSQKFKKKGRS